MESLWKIVTLGQKLKFQKTCQNPFSTSLRVVLCKKPLEKNTKYSRHETILKIGDHGKPLENRHFGSKIKIPKNMSKSIL